MSDIERQRTMKKKFTANVGLKEWIQLGGLIVTGIKTIPKLFRKRTCEWQYIVSKDGFDTACDDFFYWELKDKVTHCPNCGRKVEFK